MKEKLYDCLAIVADYFYETALNKICAIALISLGWIALKLSGNGTALAFLAIFAVPLFFAGKNHIMG